MVGGNGGVGGGWGVQVVLSPRRDGRAARQIQQRQRRPARQRDLPVFYLRLAGRDLGLLDRDLWLDWTR